MAARIHPSWWNLVLDGKLHHLEAGDSPYGSIASLRSAIYREASERGLGVVTYCEPGTRLVFFQAWDRRMGQAPRALHLDMEQSTSVPDCLNYQAPLRQVAGVARRVSAADMKKALALLQDQDQARTAVQAAGLDPADQDRIEERLYCSCGVGNATGNQRHDPSCKVWG